MGILNWFKKTKYDRSKEEVEKIMERAVIPIHARKQTTKTISPRKTTKPVFRPERKPVVIIPSEKNVFFVENSFKMTELFILNGYVRSGSIKRNMSTVFNGETLRVEGVQSSFKKAGKLEEGQRGSLEINTKTGFNLPENTELEFSFKQKSKRRVKKPKPAVPKKPKPLKPQPVLTSVPDLETMTDDIVREQTDNPVPPMA